MTKNTTMKKVEIEIPDGKRAEWINGVLTLVDDTPKDIKERIKTFEDACNTLGEKHPLVKEYWSVVDVNLDITQGLIAYLKLRIIATALNEDWEATFAKNERRYYPWFYLYTQKESEELDEDVKKSCRVPLRSNSSALASGGLVCAYAFNAGSSSNAYYGVRLAFKTEELAEYCGKQFINEWADFLFA